jgi:hypothetical protein
VRFTNLGPDSSRSFAYQLVQYRWVAGDRRYESGLPLNSLREGAVGSLMPSRSQQKTFPVRLDSGVTYLFKLEFTPALVDANYSNHTVELRYSFP